MEWWEILALAEMETLLQRHLHPHVARLLDHLISFLLLDPDSIEYARINQQHLLPQERVTEIFRQLIAITAGQDKGKAFSQLCQAIREVGKAQLADLLQGQAKECMRTGSEEKAVESRIAKPRAEYGCPEQTIYQVQEVYTRDGVVEGEAIRVVTTADRERECIAKFRKHLRSLCRAECYRSDMSHQLGDALREDVRTTYVPMQALSQREALRLARRHKKKAGSKSSTLGHMPDCDDGQSSFPLRDPADLLQDDPKYSPSSASAGAAASHHSSRKSSVAKARKTMIVSDAGKGKTMVCRRMMADFVEEECVGLQEQFDFVIPISVRGCDSLSTGDWSDFLGLDSPSLDLNPDERQTVLKHLSRNSERVLLVIDGIDESDAEAFCYTSAARAFVEQRRSSMLFDASAIITSRPCQHAYEVVAECTAHYRLTGFTEQQLEEFFCQRLGPEDGKACMSELCQPSYEHLKRTVQSTPLLATLLCQQYFQSFTVPACTTLFYVQYLRSAISRLEKKRGKPFGKVRLSRDVDSDFCGGCKFEREKEVSLHTVVVHHLEQFIEIDLTTDGNQDAVAVVKALQDLYSMCIEGLCQHQYSFRCRDLPARSLTWCLDLGLLVNSRERSTLLEGSQHVILPHLTMQEWCAARGGASCQDVVERTKHWLRCFGIEQERWQFWKFLLGTVRSDVAGILTEMKEAADFDGFLAKRFHLFLMRCLSEHRLSTDGSIASSIIGNRPNFIRYVEAANILVTDDINLAAVALDEEDTMALHRTLELVEDGSLRSLDLCHCRLSEKQVTAIALVLCKARCVLLRSNKLSGAPLEAIAKSLQSSAHVGVQALYMDFSVLISPDRDGASLALCFQHCTLTHISLHGSQLGKSGLRSLARHIGRCDGQCYTVSTLNLSDCKLSSGCGTDVAAIVAVLPNLKQLSFIANQLTNADVEVMLACLQQHRHLLMLGFFDNLLDNGISHSLVAFLQARRSLTTRKNTDDDAEVSMLPQCKIQLTGNQVTESLLQELARADVCGGDKVLLGGLFVTGQSVCSPSIQSLIQDHGGWLSEVTANSSMAELGEFLGSDSSLELLAMSHSRLSDVGMLLLAGQGPFQYSALLLLDVSSNAIHLKGATVLLDAFKGTGLQCLCLDHNPIFTDVEASSDEYVQFFAALSEFQHLKCLILAETGLQDNVAAKLLTTLKDVSGITFLGLSGNSLGESTVEVLVSLMEEGLALEIVDLEENAITDVGVDLLLGCPSVMSMEHVWLAGNQVSDQLLCRPLTLTAETFDVQFLLDYME